MTISGRTARRGGAREAMFWSKEGDAVRCTLCPHRCSIRDGKRGVCGVRENRGGILNTLIYGLATSMNVDPIEKKPLYHFHPGSQVLSFGTVGCNLKCAHCQNWSISQRGFEDVELREVTVDEVVESAKRLGCGGVSWTYNEPSIWFEFTLDGSKAAKKAGLTTSYVTNGFIEKEPLRTIAPYLDAMNIDVKAFSDHFYGRICKAKLEPVLETVKEARRLGIHVELTYLVIPGENDDPAELKGFCEWASGIDRDMPMHFSRFHPDYKMEGVPPTPMSTLDAAYRIARDSGMRYVYVGNIMPGDSRENTPCPNCGAILIERWGFSVRTNNLKGPDCPKCGESINIRL